MTRGYQRVSPALEDEIWARLRAGYAAKPTARALGISTSGVHGYLVRCGGIRPAVRRRAPGRLSLGEREEISRGLAAGLSLRAIAAGLGRAPSTISREVAGHGGRRGYRAAKADWLAWAQARRRKVCKLAARPVLRDIVAERLSAQWSPQQIAGWLKATYPDDAEMQVSHETIYRTLFMSPIATLDGESAEDEDDEDLDDCEESDEDEDDLLGSIVSFDSATGDLVISTRAAGDLTFLVTPETEIEVEGLDEDGSTADLVPGLNVLEVEVVESDDDCEEESEPDDGDFEDESEGGCDTLGGTPVLEEIELEQP